MMVRFRPDGASISLPRTSRAALGVIAAFSTATAACASSESSEPILDAGRIVAAQPGSDVTLAIGSTAEVASANLRVRFNRVVSDSRCPTKAGVQCVWAGSVVVELQGGPINGYQYLETRKLETVAGRDTTVIGGQLVRLVRVTPEKEALEAIADADYRIVLQVGSGK